MTQKPSKKVILIVLLALIALVVLLFLTVFTLNSIGKKQLLNNTGVESIPSELEEVVEEYEDYVSYNGKDYVLNENIVSVVCIGVDKTDIDSNDGIGTNGQGDTIFVACLDTDTGDIKIIPIPRDTMVDVNIYSATGNYIGVEKLPICLAYAYGDGKDTSCENMLRSVSRVLLGTSLSSYFAIDLEGFSAITNAVGGVEVNSVETMNNGKLYITEGQKIKLVGDMAMFYIRHRGSDVEASNKRLARQKQFFSAMLTKLGTTLKNDFTKLPSLYNKAAPYCVTDINLAKATYLAGRAVMGDLGKSVEFLSLKGTTVKGEKYVEFTPDAVSVYETILKAFYKEVK